MSGIRYAAPLPHYLVERHASWRERVFQRERAWYARLAAGGQHPRAMLIACCDSRVDALHMFAAQPGDLFVVRNIANLVPPCDPDHGQHGTSAAVEYAVSVLKVAHIIVVGHSDCGGVKACAQMCSGHGPDLEEKSSFIGRWMDMLRPGYERVTAAGDGQREPIQTALELEAVLTSLRNLETFPFVAEACAEGLLSLHGCWLDIATGDVRVYDPLAERFA